MWARVFQTFWPGDDPLVAVADRPGGQAGQVGARARLAEQLAPGLLAGEGAPQQPGPQLVGPVGHHGRAGHGQAEELPGPGRRGPGLGHPSVDDAAGGWAAGPVLRSPRGRRSRPDPSSNWRPRNSSTGTVFGSSSSRSWVVRSSTTAVSSAMGRTYRPTGTGGPGPADQDRPTPGLHRATARGQGCSRCSRQPSSTVLVADAGRGAGWSPCCQNS